MKFYIMNSEVVAYHEYIPMKFDSMMKRNRDGYNDYSHIQKSTHPAQSWLYELLDLYDKQYSDPNNIKINFVFNYNNNFVLRRAKIRYYYGDGDQPRTHSNSKYMTRVLEIVL